MIAFFVRRFEWANELGRRFTSATAEVDGPFRLVQGRVQGNDARVYTVEQGADAAYAAARIAERRGARVLIPLLEGAASRRAAQELELSIGDVVPVSAIWDLAALSPLLRLLPDSAREFPADPDPLLPAKPLWRGEDGLAVATTSQPLLNSHLAEHLRKRKEIVLLEHQAAGYASAAAEGELGLRPICLVTTLLELRGQRTVPALQLAQAFTRLTESLPL